MPTYNIAAQVGSLRRASLNLKVAKALMALSPETLSFELLKIGDLPLYNEDLEADLPGSWRLFRE
jgi:chromate reductase, NAD(P)H dehydrogenase (quinone)